MTIDEFHCMEHRLGWKHEYWDKAAQLSVQETAVAHFERAVSQPLPTSPPLPANYQLRAIQPDDADGLTELFERAFDDTDDFTGWPADAFRRHARDSVSSFFGETTRRHVGSAGRLSASFVIESESQLVAAAFVRNDREGPMLSPLMVDPAHQRRGLATSLLRSSLQALQADGLPTLFSACYLCNAASLKWHPQNGFVERDNSFAARHRAHHYEWLSLHHTARQQPEIAQQMHDLSEHWFGVTEKVEEEEFAEFRARVKDPVAQSAGDQGSDEIGRPTPD